MYWPSGEHTSIERNLAYVLGLGLTTLEEELIADNVEAEADVEAILKYAKNRSCGSSEL